MIRTKKGLEESKRALLPYGRLLEEQNVQGDNKKAVHRSSHLLQTLCRKCSLEDVHSVDSTRSAGQRIAKRVYIARQTSNHPN